MNIKEQLHALQMSQMGPRQVGKTTALVEAAIKLKAYFVCANSAHAEQVKQHFAEIPNPSVIPRHKEMRGLRGPFIYDHFAIEMIASESLQRIENLESEVIRLKQAITTEVRRSEDIQDQLSEYAAKAEKYDRLKKVLADLQS